MEPLEEEFLREARSNLRGLTDGLLAVEGRRDAETVDELFRTAHSLKGTCRTVGLAEASQLAHSLEDVLDALRRGEVEATAELIDEALDAVDDLEATIEAAANGTEPAVDPVATGSDLRDVLEAHRAEMGAPAEPAPEDDSTAGGDPAVADELSADVLDALEEASEFDDIDALVAEMDDVDDESLEGWGVLGEGGPTDAPVDSLDESDPEETPDDPTAFFESVKEDVGGTPTDVEDLQRDIDAVEFGEFDDDDITIDELLELDPAEDPAADPGEVGAPEPTSDGLRGSTGEPADASTVAADDSRDEPVADATGDPAPPGSRTGAAGGDGGDVPHAPNGPASPGRDPTDADPTDADPTDADPTTGESVAEAPGSEPPATDEPATDDGRTDEPGGEEPTDALDEAVAEAEQDGFEFGRVQGTDAADGSAADGFREASAAGDGPDGPTPASADEGTTSGADAAATSGEDVPDPDSLPDVDLDLSGAAVEAGTPADAGIDVELDEEMVAFESRFAGALDRASDGTEAGSESDGEASGVFQAAVTTIGESLLDGDRFGASDGTGTADTSLSDGLPPLTVTVETAERLMAIAEELSLVRHRVEEALGEEAPDLQRLAAEYRRTVTDVRLMPLETAIEDIPRTVRDLIRSQDKEVDLVIEDTDVRLGRSVIDRLRDPLVHLARNAVDHGIEPPAERVAAGKPPEGRIELRTEQVGDEVVIELSDDGRGIDPDRVRESAVERGHLSREAADELTDEETYDLLFEAGLSTADEVTDVSGRGVGMDVVGHRIATLDGRVEVESERGSGTTVRLVVPVSIALTEVVFVEVGDERFGVPMAGVEGVTEAPDDLEHRGFVRLENVPSTATPGEIEPGDDVPFVHLREALGVGSGQDPDRARILWIRTGTDLLAVGCDRVVGSRRVIVRPYEDLLRDVPGVQGATTRSDGRPVNVIDVGSL
jgi:two-component system chemotaxis sensor kinase CheA